MKVMQRDGAENYLGQKASPQTQFARTRPVCKQPVLRRGGFTLIELLVVIAIIAILAAILFPVFARARENARRASCQSNLKQLGIMVMMYTQDYDEMHPPTFYGGSASGTSQSWMRFMQPYIKSTQVFQCPSEGEAIGNAPGAGAPVHYAYNLNIGGNAPAGATSGVSYTSVSSLQAPATTVMMSDSGSLPPGWAASTKPAGTPAHQWDKRIATDKHTTWVLVSPTSTNLNFTTVDYGAPLARHLETANVLWADGHVKAHRVEKIYTNACMRPAEAENC